MTLRTGDLSDAKRSLLNEYLRGRIVPPGGAPAITRRHTGGPAPMALAQEQVWRKAQSTPDIAVYNESITIHRKGSLDVAALERSLAEIVRRHEIWRTTFDEIDGRPVQVVHPAPAGFPLRIVDHTGATDSEPPEAVVEDARRPFDLKRGPLIRATVARLGGESYRLYFIIHQIILDGVSAYQIFLPELTTLYEAFVAGNRLRLPDLPIQCADYAIWQRQWLQGDELEAQLAYWRRKLAGDLPTLNWPVSTRPPRQTFRGAIQPFAFSRELTEALRRLSKAEGVTLFTTLLAAFVTLLHRYTGQTGIIVGTVSPAGRKRVEVQRLLGYFLNPVPLRFDLAGERSFSELLQQARQTAAAAISHDDVPFERLVEELRPRCDRSRNEFFQVAISQEPPIPDAGPGWDLTPMDVESGGARWDLYFVFDDRTDGMIGRVQYNPDLFGRADILQFLEDYRGLVRSITSDFVRFRVR